MKLVLGIMSVFPGLAVVAYDCGLYVWRFVAAAVVGAPVVEAARSVVMVEGVGEPEPVEAAEVRRRHGVGKGVAVLAGEGRGDIDPT